MRKTLLTCLILMVTGMTAFADHLSDRLMFTARLDGDNNTTVLNADAHGIAVFHLNSNRDTLHVSISLANLSGPITGAHIHMGQPGEDGPVVINLTDNISANVIRTYITGTDLTENLDDMLAENLYLNVHTEDPIATGEARGQIKLERDFGFYTNLDTAQEIPAPTGLTSIGSGNFILDQNGKNLMVRVVTTGMSGEITGAHLHKAMMGENGPVIFNLSSLIDGNSLMGSIEVPDSLQMLLKSYVEQGMIYLNLHTTANPAGEIRGQGLVSKDLYIDMAADSSGVASAPMMAGGMAAGHGYINAAFDQWRYFIVYEEDSLSSAITSVSFVRDDNVVKTITTAADGKVAGTWNMTDATEPLTEDDIRAFLYGEMRFRIATTMNPDGEIEGSFIRAMREGYAFELSTDQEIPTPTVTKMPMGGGMVSISSRRMNAHYMIAWDSLSGPVTGSHFHKAVPGETGPVLFGFTSMNNAAFGYLTPDDGFGPANELQFRRDSIYINVHTDANPSGEIRGNADRDYTISAETMATSLEEVLAGDNALRIYPNPANDAISLSLEAASAFDGQVVVSDLTGRRMIVQDAQFRFGRTDLNLDLSQLPAGMYILNVRSNAGGSAALRFVKR